VDISGFSTFRGANASLLSPTWDYSFSDIVTWMKGAHTVKGGSSRSTTRRTRTGGPSIPDSSASPRPAIRARRGTHSPTRSWATSARIARPARPIGYFRFWQFEGFVSDAWRLSQKLSVEVGVRYAWQQPTYTLGNNTTSFDPAVYDPRRP